MRRVAIVAALLVLGLQPRLAAASNRTLEAESMAIAPPASVVDDARASGGRAVELVRGADASGTLVTKAPAYWLSARAKGANCFGPARIDVNVDGVERFSGPVSTGRYGLAEARLPALPPGNHRVTVRLSDAGGIPLGCEHTARIDRVDLYAPFADGSFRNRPLSPDARLSRHSKRIVASLRRQALVKPGTVWVNTTNWSVPVYTVPRTQPPVRVDSPDWEVEKQLRGAPIPDDAHPADPASGDSELVLYQPSTDTMWDFHHLVRKPGAVHPRWEANWGGRMTHVSTNPGYFTNARGGLTFGASASRLSLFGGLQTIDELERRRIDHTVDLILPNVTQGSHVWPAQDSDQFGHEIGPDPIPEGTRFRLPASLDIAALGLPPYTRTLALAIQRHGAVVRDRGGVVSFKAEDPRPRGYNPYPRIFGGRYPNQDQLLARFPWRKLEVVAPPKGR
jgi:hypothetical protein